MMDGVFLLAKVVGKELMKLMLSSVPFVILIMINLDLGNYCTIIFIIFL